jgi:NAD(P)H dehydrogenase (quinone)
MKALVVIGHQRRGSFCHAIAETTLETLKAAGHEVVYHDLYAEDFDPILPDEEIPKEAMPPENIQRYCEELTSADGIVIVHPNWWGQPPAILKGWIDRVFRQGVVTEFTAEGVKGLLAGKKALVFTTSNTPRDVEQKVFGDPLENLWKTVTFGLCGVTDFYRRNFESVVMSTEEERKAWLGEVTRIVSERFSEQE